MTTSLIKMAQAPLDVMTVNIPNSLRSIGPFFEEAQSIMRQKEKGNKKVMIYCIDHALKLVGQFGLNIGELRMRCRSYIVDLTKIS